jgi:hypothetical protein
MFPESLVTEGVTICLIVPAATIGQLPRAPEKVERVGIKCVPRFIKKTSQ